MLRHSILLVVLAASSFAFTQDRLPTMPRYERYARLRSEILTSVAGGNIDAAWAKDSRSFTFTKGATLMRYDLATHRTNEAKEEEESAQAMPSVLELQQNRARPERGRQFDVAYSPDGGLKAFYKDRNLHVSKTDGSSKIDVTTEGSAAARTKFGSGSWVYGEELEAHEAMWWSPDGKKLAYYKFDESKTPDYYIAMHQVNIQDTLDTEAYPKVDAPNPIVDLYVYDLAAQTRTWIDKNLSEPELGEYVYDVQWSPDGHELLFHRTNRKQNHLQLCAADPNTGRSRVVVDEAWPNSWVENHPPTIWLKDHKNDRQFLWLSERNGYRNIYLGNLNGAPLKAVTQFSSFEVQSVIGVDEPNHTIFFLARDGDSPYKLQLHRIDFDGSKNKRLTDPTLTHAIQLSPDHKTFIDAAQNLTTPVSSRLCDAATGRILDTVATADTSKFERLGLKKAERIIFKAADGITDCYGYITTPSDFDPSKKYPLLVFVYGGPESGSGQERFTLPNPLTELGFIVAWLDGRGTSGRGKAFEDAVYEKLGVVEIDDQAAGVKYLAQRSYIDGTRVGIQGTSYGGYASAMALLRHPEAFKAAVASSPVTDWRNYDSIYTERYMGLATSDDNRKGYDAGSAMTYAPNLKGHLMLYYGTSDNNVHPANTLQLVQKLQQAGKSFDLMAGPDLGHTQINADRMWEYFVDYLILGK